jgi:hypothetical protein
MFLFLSRLLALNILQATLKNPFERQVESITSIVRVQCCLGCGKRMGFLLASRTFDRPQELTLSSVRAIVESCHDLWELGITSEILWCKLTDFQQTR